jgi:hypothetical protein
MNRTEAWLTALVALGVFAAIVALLPRVKAENANRAVEIVLDGDQLSELATESSVPLPEAALRLRRAGATALGITEQTASGLADAGRIFISPTPAFRGLRLTTRDPGLFGDILRNLRAKFPQRRQVYTSVDVDSHVDVEADRRELDLAGLGFPADQVAAARAAGLRVIPRLRNYPSITTEAIEFMLDEAQQQGADMVVFADEDVLGFQGLIAPTARALRQRGLIYGNIELEGQKGGGELTSLLWDRVVWLHSIAGRDQLSPELSRALRGRVPGLPEMITEEWTAMKPSAAIPRFLRAARERDIRACYVRLLWHPQPDRLAVNAQYLTALADALRRDGLEPGRAEPFPPFKAPRWTAFAIVLGIAAAAVLLLGRLTALNLPVRALLFVIFAALGWAWLLKANAQGVKMAALTAACIFPAFSLTVLWQRLLAAPKLTGGSGPVVGRAAVALLWVCGISLAGGLYVAGLLSNTYFLVRAEAFSGVKLSQLAPLGLLCLVMLGGAGGGRYLARAEARLRSLWSRPVLVGELALAVLLAGAVFLMITRSGNRPILDALGFELKARAWLEQILIARPRTKEFLFGYPALMLGVGLALRGNRRWIPVLMLAAVIGQTSLVNTLCHIHSPLSLSLLRIGNGVVLGLIAGALVTWAWDRLSRRQPASTP